MNINYLKKFKIMNEDNSKEKREYVKVLNPEKVLELKETAHQIWTKLN